VLVAAWGPDTAAARRADGHRVPQGRGRLSAVVSAAACDVSGGGQPDGCGCVRCPGCGPSLRSRGPAVSASRSCRSLRVSAVTGSGRLTGVRWWGVATGARPAGAAGRAAGGAARAHRSWPAAPGPGPPSLTRAVAPGRCRARVVVGSRPGRPPQPGAGGAGGGCVGPAAAEQEPVSWYRW
jgi:hypothetical protein